MGREIGIEVYGKIDRNLKLLDLSNDNLFLCGRYAPSFCWDRLIIENYDTETTYLPVFDKRFDGWICNENDYSYSSNTLNKTKNATILQYISFDEWKENVLTDANALINRHKTSRSNLKECYQDYVSLIEKLKTVPQTDEIVNQIKELTKNMNRITDDVKDYDDDDYNYALGMIELVDTAKKYLDLGLCPIPYVSE